MQRRQLLLAKIAGQREQMAVMATRWQPAFRVADLAWLAVNFARNHAVLVAGVAGLTVVRRRGVVGLLKGGWRVWKAWRYVNEFAKKITR